MADKITGEDARIQDKIEAWQGLMNRIDTSGEVLRMLHDDVDCLIAPGAPEYFKRRAEEIKQKLLLLAAEVDWISDMSEIPGVAESTDPARRR